MDKRILKTKKSLFYALLDLTAEEDISKIKVVSLCQRAGINKSTFYLHFSTFQECIDSCVDYIIDISMSFVRDLKFEDFSLKSSQLSKSLATFAKENTDVIFKYQKSSMSLSLTPIICKKIVDEICNNSHIILGSAEREKISILAYGIVGLVCNSHSIDDFDSKEEIIAKALQL